MSAMRVDVLPSPVHYRCFPHPPFIPGIGTRIRTTGTRGHTQPLIRAPHGHGTGPARPTPHAPHSAPVGGDVLDIVDTPSPNPAP